MLQGTMEKLEKYCRMKFRISESDVLPAVDLVDGTARSKLAAGTRGGVSRCSNHAEQIITITIPREVETLDDSCFSGCTSLEEVIFADDSQLDRIGK